MMLHKEMLKVGDHHSPDGKVTVTKERIKHWQDEHKRLEANGNVVPVRYDHTNHITPMSMEEFKRPETKDTVGRLHEIKPLADGSGAEVFIEFRDQEAYDKAKQNVLRLSPVIMDQWLDGQKNEYKDVVTHMDMVNHAVDASQGDFKIPTTAMALRMGLGKKVYHLSDEEPKGDNDGDEPPAKKDGEGDTQKSGDGSGDTAGGSLKDLIANLAKMKIPLPPDTTEKNLVERLNVAVGVAIANDPDADTTTGVPGAGGSGSNNDVAGVNAPPVMMSLEKLEGPAKAMYETAQKMWRMSLESRLDALVKTGRATPDEVHKYLADLKTVRMSLTEKGETASTAIDFFVTAREGVPAGTFFDPDTKVRMSQDVQVVGPGGGIVAGAETEEEAEENARRILRKPKN